MEPAQWLTVTTEPAPAVADGRACRTRAALFDEVARVLEFPPYFGRNWDALVDSLRDVVPVALTVAYAEQLLVDEPPSALATLFDIMRRAAYDGLTLTLSTDPAHEAALRQRLTAALNH
jgi:Barstar (barnase inhibitor)